MWLVDVPLKTTVPALITESLLPVVVSKLITESVPDVFWATVIWPD